MALFLSIAARMGLTGIARTLAAWAMAIGAAIALVMAIWGGWSWWLSRHDKAVVADDRRAAGEIANTITANAGAAANAAQAKRDADFDNSQDQLKEKADAAAHDGDSPLDALFNRMR